MDNKKRIRDLTNTTTAPQNTDFLVLDNGTTNKITRANLLAGTPLPADTVDTQAIENDAVTTNKVADGAVTPNKLGLSPQQGYIATNQSTSSTSYTDLGTVGPSVTVTVGANGLALVNLFIGNVNNTGTNQRSYAGFAASGANTIAAVDTMCLVLLNTGVAQRPQISLGGTFLLTGLTAGSTTFTVKYKVNGGTGEFMDRRISVIPL